MVGIETRNEVEFSIECMQAWSAEPRINVNQACYNLHLSFEQTLKYLFKAQTNTVNRFNYWRSEKQQPWEQFKLNGWLIYFY